MPFCSNCGKQVPNGSKFCYNCGSSIVTDYQSTSKRTTVFEGEIHKCPSCGAVLKAFEHKCKECGHEIRSINNHSVVQEFAEKLEKTKSIAKKNELISNFYIPNTKEDIYEFFILAISNLTTDTNCEESWKAKLEQTYHKAKLSFGNTSEFEYIEKLYLKTMSQYNSRSFNRFLKKSWKFLLGFALALIGLILIVYGNFKGSETGDGNSPYYMLGVMGFFPFMFGIYMFIWGATSNKKNSNTQHVEIEEDELKDEEESDNISIKDKIKNKINDFINKK